MGETTPRSGSAGSSGSESSEEDYLLSSKHSTGKNYLYDLAIGSIRYTIIPLWMYLWWYLWSVVNYDYMTNNMFWSTAAVMATIVGIALNVNALSGSKNPIKEIKKNPFKSIRFFIIPFCVSSFSAVAAMSNFVVLFPRDTMDTIYGLIGLVVIGSLLIAANLFINNQQNNTRGPRIESISLDTRKKTVDSDVSVIEEPKKKKRTCAQFLIGSIRYPVIPLWCYMWWYLWILYSYYGWVMENHEGTFWPTAGFLSIAVGVVLNVNALNSSRPIIPQIVDNPFKSLRFFIIPFCVSSYSAIASIVHFVSIFPNDGRVLGIGFGVGVGMALIMISINMIYERCSLEARQKRQKDSEPKPQIVPPPGDHETVFRLL